MIRETIGKVVKEFATLAEYEAFGETAEHQRLVDEAYATGQPGFLFGIEFDTPEEEAEYFGQE